MIKIIFMALPLAFVVFAMTMYVHTHLGISHVLSAILATPGCEMRAIPHLAALAFGGNVAAQVCPGPWDDLDRWEDGRSRVVILTMELQAVAINE